MTRVQKGKKSSPSLVCTRAKLGAASHSYRSVHQSFVEEAFLDSWQNLLVDIPAGDVGEGADVEHENLQGVIWAEEEHLEGLLRIFERKPSQSVASHIASIEAQLRSLRADLTSLARKRMQADHGLVQARVVSLEEALGHGSETPEPIDIGRVNAALKVLFSSVTIDHLTVNLRFEWRQGGMGSIMY